MTKFVVINENSLGCINDRQPDRVSIIASSVLRGAALFPDGDISVPTSGMRLAVREDFDAFRVSYSKGYQNSAEYEPLDTCESSISKAVEFMKTFFPEYLVGGTASPLTGVSIPPYINHAIRRLRSNR